MLFALFTAFAQPAEILGTLHQDEVAAALVTQQDAFASCRSDAGDGISGSFTVKLIVGKKGTVTRTQVKASTLSDTVLPKCYADAMATLVFPTATVGIQVVSQPFVVDAK